MNLLIKKFDFLVQLLIFSIFVQCCGSWMCITDPGSRIRIYPSRIPGQTYSQKPGSDPDKDSPKSPELNPDLDSILNKDPQQ